MAIKKARNYILYYLHFILQLVLQFINFCIAILIIYLIFIIDFFIDRHDPIIHTLHKRQFDIFIKYTFNTRHQILLFKKR